MRRILAALAAVGIALSVGAVVQSQTEPAVEHVSVRAGEGLWQVAARLCPGNVAAEFTALQQANPWYAVGLHPGTVLHRPEGSCPATSTTTTTTTSTTTTLPPVDDGFPTPETTGARYKPTTVIDGTVTTSADGQVIEGVEIFGNLRIRHNNVTVRDVIVHGVGRYMLHVDNLRNQSVCPTGVVVEYVEVDGSTVAPDQIPVYAECGATLDHLYVHDSGRGVRLVNDGTLTNSYIIANRWSGSFHRTAVGMNGGSNNAIIGNALFCEGSNCSSAVSAYGDFAPTDGFRVERNLVATSSYYCIYGGSGGPSNQYPDGSNVAIVGNHFSRRYSPNCGISAPIIAFANGVRGNTCHGNVWHETGLPADDACG